MSNGWPTVAGYDVLAELGHGGMGVVYRAVRKQDGLPVALKAIRPSYLSDPRVVDRFLRESKALTRLNHPHIVRAYGTEQDGPQYYLVMEYVEGINLSDLVQGKRGGPRGCGPLPVEAACECVRQAALGLQHVFECGLVHRDIKPNNLLLAPAPAPGCFPDDGAVVRLLDLGLVRLQPLGAGAPAADLPVEPPDDAPPLTPDNVLLGTPDYVAPEQATRPREADIRADLYSLGCTLYFLLSGRIPFPGKTTPLEKVMARLIDDPVPLDHVRTGLPSAAVEVVTRLLQRSPDDRYQTPADLAAALGPLCNGTAAAPAVVVAPARPAAVTAVPAGEVRCLTGHTERVLSVAFGPDGRHALSGAWDRTLRLWDVEDGREVACLNGHAEGVNTVALSPDGRLAVSGGMDGVLRLWDLAGRREERRFEGHTEAVTSAAFSPDGNLVLSGSLDGTLRLWEVATGRELQRLLGHSKCVNAVAFSPDGRWALSGGGTFHHRDYALRLWDVEAGRPLGELAGHTDAVGSVAFGPDGRLALSGGWDQIVRLWDVGAGRELRRFEGHRQLVWSVAFSPDGRYALSGSRDRSLRLWDVETGDDLRCFEKHAGWVTSVAFAPDGRLALSGSSDRTLRVWQLPEFGRPATGGNGNAP